MVQRQVNGSRETSSTTLVRVIGMTEKQNVKLSAGDNAGWGDAPGSTLPPRVLIADDDPYIRQLLELALADDGFEVLCAADGYELVRLAQERSPNLILIDLSMPRMDGYEAIRQMRNDTRTAHIPMLILTARSGVKDIVTGFETGADDYIAKPFDITELLARVRSHLRRSAQRPVLNPLTGLPGGMLLAQEMRRRLGADEPIALLYADLDNFKAFNDIYGFSRGDQAILFVANLIKQVVGKHGGAEDFIGHIGGDDFAILTTPEHVDRICRALITTFDQGIGGLYNSDDRARGYISSTDRYGILRRFSLMTISIGVVTTERRRFDDEDTLTRVAAEMKRYAKEQGGSTFAVDQRNSNDTHGNASQPNMPERRGRTRGVLLASDDSSLRIILQSTLRESGYAVFEATGADLQYRILAERPAVVLADGELGKSLWEVCAARRDHAESPIIVLAYQEEVVARAHIAGADVCLRLPLPLTDIIQCIDRITRSSPSIDDSSASATSYYHW
jgi:DNA-binding response OmpR family regulator